MNQRIRKYKIIQATVDSFSGYLIGSALSVILGLLIVVPFLRSCADEQYANELKAKQNMYVRVQVEGDN
ncbi:hypothetical protein [Acinetobacter nosocomialis]|uniref:hypothetical protein n=1 Tax=Acinetobacter nosocomialis TaxID=106654 RepID=UPI000DE7B75A|nr:hypothetical protein [Acinetobacter nosocomialis]SSO33494.1 Uncharacterised protein [Acinetobacter nosocomialis]SSP54159.1 Uncharacterised protein [Acinetobacter nosocomialis]SSQ38705.1 Uncharacterised protein [Acinetobacter baumannii]